MYVDVRDHYQLYNTVFLGFFSSYIITNKRTREQEKKRTRELENKRKREQEN